MNKVLLNFFYSFKLGMKHGLEMMEDEPLMKKQKTEESLEPELQFMMKFNVKYTIKKKINLKKNNNKKILSTFSGSCYVQCYYTSTY